MTGLSQTLTALARYRRDLHERDGAGHLTEVHRFGANPGALRMLTYAPPDLEPGAALVVALHGCTQTASSFDLACGWSDLAARHGFALLFPQQDRANNAGGCLNWFNPADTERGGGEAASVHAMIEHLVRTRGIGRERIHVTGLSAGGAFANVMLATYPELFAGGAILSGLAYGVATQLQSAITLMTQGNPLPAQDLAARVRRASAHAGPWPRVSVWHGLSDAVVVPANGMEVARQWCAVQGLAEADGRPEQDGAATRRVWRDRTGNIAVTLTLLPKFGHAVPLSLTDPDPDRRCGQTGAFAAEAGVSAPWEIARDWNLLQPGASVDHRQPKPGIIGRVLKATGLLP
jgi:poly(hydroxyalkanoate) depolymerase family esterase